MSVDEKKLDNPVWYSLTETHRSFAIDYGSTKFYDPDYCPFGGFDHIQNVDKHIHDYSILADNFFVVGEKPSIPSEIDIKKELICLQMLVAKRIEYEIDEEIILLRDEHTDALFHLVNRVQPGYFKGKTSLLGDYYGIFKRGRLIAVTGERMKMEGYTEVSAIVTDPEYTGKGYAKQLIAHAVNSIFCRNEKPYLHVVENNTGAIDLYEKLGFVTRRKISFWHLVRQ